MEKTSTFAISLTAIFSALYVVFSIIPIGTPFIGGTTMMSLNLVMTPILGFLGPIYGTAAALIGSFIAIGVAPQSAIFGIFSPLVPLTGVLCVVLALRRSTMLIAGIFVLGTSAIFLLMRFSAFWFVLPHITVAIFMILVRTFKVRSEIQLLSVCMIGTFGEQCAMFMLSIFVLNLPAALFGYIIFPLMLYERCVGSIGSFLILLGIQKRGLLERIVFTEEDIF